MVDPRETCQHVRFDLLKSTELGYYITTLYLGFFAHSYISDFYIFYVKKYSQGYIFFLHIIKSKLNNFIES